MRRRKNNLAEMTDGARRVLAEVAEAEERERARANGAVSVGPMFELRADGVYDISGENDEHICGPLWVLAATRNRTDANWGRMLEWIDKGGKLHRRAVAMDKLSGSGEEVRKLLLHEGLYVSAKRGAREKLNQYLQKAKPRSDVLLTCTEHVGWHDDKSFVLPDKTIGAEQVIYQADAEVDHKLNVSGTVDDWRENVGKLCSGNDRLVLAVSCAFAGPLLKITGVENGGIHYVGASSQGKTIAQYTAGSVCGGGGDRGYVESWRTTDNGLEITAAAHNDLMLPLDEIEEINPYDIVKSAYMLANGQPKTRMDRSLGSRRRPTWRLPFLSSGEKTLADHAASVGKRTRGGAEVRVLNIRANPGENLGVFQNLHGRADGKTFADELKAAALEYYGAPIRAFLERVVACRDEIKKRWPQYRDCFLEELSEYVKKDSPGEVHRAATRMAVIAFGGCLATEWNLTGWKKNESSRACGNGLADWIETRGGPEVRADDQAAIHQVCLFIQNHGVSRFESTERRVVKVYKGGPSEECIEERTEEEDRVALRAGFRGRDKESGETEYWCFPAVFTEQICEGFTPTAVVEALSKAGYLHRSSEEVPTRSVYVNVLGRTVRVYAIRESILGPLKK
jgi:uncharacterized protein (DUF927 family)